MARKGSILLNRIKSRPIHEAAKQQQAEFNDPYSTALGFGTSLMEGYKLGKKIVDKGERMLDTEASRRERGTTGEKFTSFEEYQAYNQMDEGAKYYYDNPLRAQKELGGSDLEARIPEISPFGTFGFDDSLPSKLSPGNETFTPGQGQNINDAIPAFEPIVDDEADLAAIQGFSERSQRRDFQENVIGKGQGKGDFMFMDNNTVYPKVEALTGAVDRIINSAPGIPAAIEYAGNKFMDFIKPRPGGAVYGKQ